MSHDTVTVCILLLIISFLSHVREREEICACLLPQFHFKTKVKQRKNRFSLFGEIEEQRMHERTFTREREIFP
jgi:hypothetical protein